MSKYIIAVLLPLLLLTLAGCQTPIEQMQAAPKEPRPTSNTMETEPVIPRGNAEHIASTQQTDSLEYADPDDSYADMYSLPLSERGYERIPPQQIPEDIVKRDGKYVLQPYALWDFFSEYDLYQEEGSSTVKDYYGFKEDYWGGCSVWCSLLYKASGTASSSLSNKGSISYSAQNLLDFQRNTAWCEGAKGYGIGEYVDISYTLGYSWELGEGDILEGYESRGFDYTSLCIVNGYAKDDYTWHSNSRVKTLKMYVNGEPQAYIELEDAITPQYFVLHDIQGLTNKETLFRFEIADIYPGEKYEDTCLTGIVFGFSGVGGH